MLKSVWKFKQNMEKSHKTCMEQTEIIDMLGTYQLLVQVAGLQVSEYLPCAAVSSVDGGLVRVELDAEPCCGRDRGGVVLCFVHRNEARSTCGRRHHRRNRAAVVVL